MTENNTKDSLTKNIFALLEQSSYKNLKKIYEIIKIIQS